MLETTDGAELDALAEHHAAGHHGASMSLRASLARAAVRSRLFETTIDAPSFGRYRWLRPLGKGGMGTVVVAEDPLLDREVAVKLVEADDPRLRARVVREAQAHARVAHPNVVAVYDVGVADHRVYIVMELVHGDDLRAWITAAPRSWREIVAVYLAAGEGLAAVHAAGLVHRDMKPANVVVGPDGRARLIDFGIARAMVDPSGADPSSDAIDAGATFGDRAGTPAYVSPEQLVGGTVDARADQFSFCVALWEALAGARPGGAAAVFGISEGPWPPPPPRGTPVPPAIWRALARGLAAEPEHRHPSMAELLSALQRAAPSRRRRLAWIGGAAAAIGVFGVGWPLVRAQDDACAEIGRPGRALWAGEARAAVEDHLARTATGLGEAAWPRVDAALDEYARAWEHERTAACASEGPTPDGAPARCFAWGLTTTQQLVTELARTDAARLGGLVDRVLHLPSPTRCRDPIALAVEPPLPPRALQPEVEAARLELAEVDRSLRIADFATALAQAEALVADADAWDFAPLRAEVALRIGRAHAELGAWAEARAAFEHSHALAEPAGYAAVASESAAALAELLAVRLGEPAEAGAWSKRALAAARATAEPLLVTDAEWSIAAVEVALGHYTAAEGLYEGLRARLRRECPEPCASLVDVEVQLSLVHDRVGNRDAATAHARAGVELAEAAYGRVHPSTAAAHNQLCIALDTDGRSAEAAVECTIAVDITREIFGDEHAETATALAMLGSVEALIDVSLARRHLGEAYAILVRTLGPDHPNTLAALSNRGLLDRTDGDLVAAEQAFSIALTLLAATESPDPLALATLHHNEATVLIDLERDDEAIEHLQQTLELRRAVGVDATQLAMTLTQLGGALWRRGRADEARDALERAMATESDQVDPFNRALLRYYLAGSLAESDRPRALRLLADALRELEVDPSDELGLAAECRRLAAKLRARDRAPR